jgi:hypothetical protein
MPTVHRRTPALRRGGRVALLLASGYALLLVAWIGGNPPFAGPDETGHYIRALSVGAGQLVGEPVPGYASDDLDPRQLAMVRQEVRRVDIPERLSPVGRTCYVHLPRESAACLDRNPTPQGGRDHITNVGTYQPALYLLPGLTAPAGRLPDEALLLGRVGSALLAGLLLAGAAWAVWRPGSGALPLLGMLVALTPMCLFVMSVLNPSGPEIAAGVASAAALLGLAGPPPDRRRTSGLWALAGAAGVVLALSRALGPVWVLLYAAAFVLWAGRRRAAAAVRARPRAVAAVGVALAAAVGANLVFQAAYGPDLDVRLRAGDLVAALPVAAGALSWQTVGVFGYIEVPLPAQVYVGWALLAALLGAAALLVGTTGQRLRLLATALAAGAVPVLLEALVMGHHGFSVQGRHVLPVVVAVPLVAAQVLAVRADAVFRSPVRHLASLVVAGAPAMGFLGWYTNARRAAVGTEGTWLFAWQAEWSPVSGWFPWLLLAGVGSGLLLAAGVLALRGAPRHVHDAAASEVATAPHPRVVAGR